MCNFNLTEKIHLHETRNPKRTHTKKVKSTNPIPVYKDTPSHNAIPQP